MIIRKVVEEDRALITEWIQADEDHCHKMTADFFFQPLTLNLSFADELGTVFFVRLDPEPDHVVRIHIQFRPDSALRTIRTLKQGFVVVEDRARAAKAKKLVFDSVSDMLINFCCNRLGFSRVEGTNDLELELEGAVV